MKHFPHADYDARGDDDDDHDHVVDREACKYSKHVGSIVVVLL